MVVRCVHRRWSVGPIYRHNAPKDRLKLILQCEQSHGMACAFAEDTTKNHKAKWHGPLSFMRICNLLISQQPFLFSLHTMHYVPTCGVKDTTLITMRVLFIHSLKISRCHIVINNGINQMLKWCIVKMFGIKSVLVW